jgi:hypothetical protein
MPSKKCLLHPHDLSPLLTRFTCKKPPSSEMTTIKINRFGAGNDFLKNHHATSSIQES